MMKYLRLSSINNVIDSYITIFIFNSLNAIFASNNTCLNSSGNAKGYCQIKTQRGKIRIQSFVTELYKLF